MNTSEFCLQKQGSEFSEVTFGNATSRKPLVVAFGPELPEFGSWQWVGADVAQELSKYFEVKTFQRALPACDVAVFVKFKPALEKLHLISQRTAMVYCPVDIYGSRFEIEADASSLHYFDRILVHSQRLSPYFEPYTHVEYMDHHTKFAAPMRETWVSEGPLLWVGVRSNLPPLVEWVNRHTLPEELWVLTNLEDPNRPVSAEDLGFNRRNRVRVEPWSAERQKEWTSLARGSLDIKGDDFRSRHKPPSKAIDFLASGIPLAMNPNSSSVEHLAHMGFTVAAPEDDQRWLSEEYWHETVRFSRVLRELLSRERIGLRYKWILEFVWAERQAR